jgi:hypothetical protein
MLLLFGRLVLKQALFPTMLLLFGRLVLKQALFPTAS